MTNRSSQVFLLQTELDAANAKNERLIGENAQLRAELERLNGDEVSKASYNVEASLRAFQMENERDRMHESLEKIKRKYNQLHEAFLQKLKRCKALEDVFSRQKTLTGLVMKSIIAQKELEQKFILENKQAVKMKQSAAVEALQSQVVTLQKELVEKYDIIDEMEFELESIDFLETENQRMQDELLSFKRQNLQGFEESHVSDAPPKCSELDGVIPRCNTDSLASSLADSFAGDMDTEAIARAALTGSLIKNVESESNCLRRELLRSRLQRTNRAVRPRSGDA